MPDYTVYSDLTVEVSDKVATVTLNRPDRLNAINFPGLHEELENVMLDLNADPDVHVIILTGSGRAFSAGGDIEGMKQRAANPDLRYLPTGYGRRLILNMLEVQQPIIAALNGDAVGLGATLALFCDIIIAADTARVGDPHVRVGLVAGDGGAIIWPALIGVAKAKEFLMTGNLLSAEEAERIGLINKVVPADELMDSANQMASRLANGATLAIRWTKFSINKHLRIQMNQVLDTSLALEALTFLSKDHMEAADAFLEKRRPNFTGQ